jgi:DNA-binding LytR/AlgR family response regulator
MSLDVGAAGRGRERGREMRVLVVDDEKPARSELRFLLEREGAGVEEAANAVEALELVEKHSFDAVFLDVEMPGSTGIEATPLVRGGVSSPPVVFVTAHAEYAVEAFAVEAFDYLLKPVDSERLARVLERLRGREAPGPASPRRIPVVAGGRTELVDQELIHYVQADGDYSRLHTHDRAYLCTASLGELEETLPPTRFVRIHRSYLVNLARVAAVKRGGPDRIRLVLDDAARTELDVARRQSRRVRELLGL